MEFVERQQHELVTRSPRDVVRALAAFGPTSTSQLLAFDGDGTLWTGDVGEDVFHRAVKDGLLRADARDALVREAAAYSIDTKGTASEIAARLFEAYLAGSYPEREVCGMMSYCYAGFELEELETFIDSTLESRGIRTRLNQELASIFEFARDTGLRIVVVSASPQPIVERAARYWRIPPADVAACRHVVSAGRILPELAAPVPYAEAKLSALARIGANPSQLLASFGDNVFDMELLRAARLGVAVRPKPGLVARLAELPGVVVLRTENG